jgi:hypothetical protein
MPLHQLNHSSFKSVYFIDATNISTIQSSFRSLGYHEAKLSNSLDDQDMINGVHAWLETHYDPILLIFDNADDRNIDLGSFIPRCECGRVIITTRNEAQRVHAHPTDCHSQIGELLPEEAISLLHQLIPPDERDYPDAQLISEQIVHELGYLALAIAHAGSYIASSSDAFMVYLEIFRSKRFVLLSQKPELAQDKYNLAAFTTWELSFNRLTIFESFTDEISVVASDFLQLCAFLHPKDISPGIFKRAFERHEPSSPAHSFFQKLSDSTGHWDSHTFNAAINRLASYSFITVVTESQYQIHPLVQSWTKDRLSASSRSLYQSTILRILADSIALGNTFTLGNNTTETDTRQVLVPHLFHIGVSSIAQDGTARIFASIFREAGYQTPSEILEMGIRGQRVMELAGDHPNTLTSLSNLAETYRAQARLAALQIKIVERRIMELGEDHPETRRIKANLAPIYGREGRMSNPELLEAKSMRQAITKRDEDHVDALEKQPRRNHTDASMSMPFADQPQVIASGIFSGLSLCDDILQTAPSPLSHIVELEETPLQATVEGANPNASAPCDQASGAWVPSEQREESISSGPFTGFSLCSRTAECPPSPISHGVILEEKFFRPTTDGDDHEFYQAGEYSELEEYSEPE